mgnify:CR=1 FL=1
MKKPLALLLCLSPLLAACVEQPQQSRQPAFYASLAAPGARIDPYSSRNLINDYRRNLNLPPVEIDPELQRFAEQL